MRAVVMVAAALLGTGSVAQAGIPKLVEEVVATIDTRALLLSELEAEARLMRARARGAALLEAPMTAVELRSALDELVNRTLVHAEAERLQVYEVRGPEVDAARAAVTEQLGAAALEAFCSTWELDDRSLGEMLRRELRVQRYLEGRFRLASRPRDPDVKSWLAGRGRPQPTEAEVAAAREALGRQRFAELVAAYVRDIRRRATVVVLRDFDAPGSELPKSGASGARGMGR
jgi:hypothetical protein